MRMVKRCTRVPSKKVNLKDKEFIIVKMERGMNVPSKMAKGLDKELDIIKMEIRCMKALSKMTN